MLFIFCLNTTHGPGALHREKATPVHCAKIQMCIPFPQWHLKLGYNACCHTERQHGDKSQQFCEDSPHRLGCVVLEKGQKSLRKDFSSVGFFVLCRLKKTLARSFI